MKKGFIYILASHRNGTIYTGVTSDLRKRIKQHKLDIFAGFTRKYSVHTLVYFEEYDNLRSAIEREKFLKRWDRRRKIELIETKNPGWYDLFDELSGSIQNTLHR